jgi:hypothetical protein
LEDVRLTSLLTSLPKVELHVHLEGATDAETVWWLAQRNGVQLPANSLADWKEHYAFRDFPHFIEVYGHATAAMQSPVDWQFMLERFAQGQAEQNIVYSEVFLSASYHLRKLPADEWLAARRQQDACWCHSHVSRQPVGTDRDVGAVCRPSTGIHRSVSLARSTW